MSTLSKKKNKTGLGFCLILSIVLVVGCYFYDNIAYPFRLDTGKYSFFEYLRRNKPVGTKDTEEAVFVNVSYDKMLIVDTVEVPDTNRKRAITDRKALLEFLHKVESLNYRYLFIDLRFEDKERTEYDSALTAQLLKMRDVAIAKHWDIANGQPFRMMDDRLVAIGQYCDFDESRSSAGFFKYKYLQEGGNSIAAELYRKETGKSITRQGPFYFDGWHLCQNAKFLVIHTSMENEWQDDYEQNYWHMGPDLLHDTNCWRNFQYDISGKYLIVGDMKEDMHNTYVGAQPGAYLHWLGFKSLMDKRHFVHGGYVLIMMLIYFLVSFIILQRSNSNDERWSLLRKIEHQPLLHFFFSLLGYGALLFVLSAILYLLFDTAYNIFVPSVCFALLSHYVQLKKNED